MAQIIYQIFLIFLLAVTLPLVVAVSLLIVLLDGLPVVYRQRRVGLRGKPFTMYKFRTMVVGAEKLQPKLRWANEADGPVFKIRNDSRFTPLGKFLSHTGLDELPQLVNVLKGEMALIGPRPLPPSEVKRMAPWHRLRHAILPGIISPWVLSRYYHSSFDQWMKSDLEYVKSKSLLRDIQLFWQAARVILWLLWRETRQALTAGQ